MRLRGYDVVANPTYHGDRKSGVIAYKDKQGGVNYKDVWT
jgi:hypothetical protein